MHRKWLFLITSLVLLVSQLVQARTLDDIVASGYIEVAVYRDFPPYSYMNDQQQAAGVDVELGKLIAAGLNVEPRWHWITAGETTEDDLRNAIWKGHIVNKRYADLMMRVPYDREFSYAIDGYGLAKNDQVVMFGPYHEEQWVFARNLEKVGSVRTLAIFMYQKVGVELDSLPDFFLSGTHKGRLRENVVHFTTVFDAIDDLQAGNVSAVAGMKTQIEWGLGKASGDYDVDDDGLGAITKKTWDIGMAVKHTNRQLGYAVEAVVEKAVTSGEVEKLFTQNGLSYELPSLYKDIL